MKPAIIGNATQTMPSSRRGIATNVHVGSVFGLLTVKEFIGSDGHSKWWRCSCECGGTRDTRTATLVSGKAKCCGCAARVVLSNIGKRRRVHGLSASRIHKVWTCMKQRCSNPNTTNWGRYGGRGIRVCQEWQESFVAFQKWASANGYQDNWQLDRIDNNGPYAPWNCKFSTAKEQAANRRVRWDSVKWRVYSEKKSFWLSKHPSATPDQVAKACREIADQIGI